MCRPLRQLSPKSTTPCASISICRRTDSTMARRRFAAASGRAANNWRGPCRRADASLGSPIADALPYETIRTRQDRAGQCQAQRFCGVDVDHQFKACRSLERKVGWTRACEDLVDVTRNSPHRVGRIWPICQQQSVLGPVSPAAGGDDSALCNKFGYLLSLLEQQACRHKNKSLCTLADTCLECRIKIRRLTHLEGLNFNAQLGCSVLRFPKFRISVVRIPQNCDAGDVRHSFLEKLQKLPRQFIIDQSDTGHVAARARHA